MIELVAIVLFVITIVAWGRFGAPLLARDWTMLVRDLDPPVARSHALLFTRTVGEP